MCAIAGIIHLKKDKGLIQKIHLEQMIEAAHHRGPDSDGFFICDNVGLGHCRLSVIDLSKNGQQPMQSEDGNVTLVYNGEIYNYIELTQELKKLGHVFTSNSDTEVILHAYQQWGPEGFTKFNGDWAFAIFDNKNNKVILSRDRFSVKPLYYTIQDSTLYFASEIKQLLPFLPKKELNYDVMYSFLKQGILDSDEQTFFRGILKVKPNHNLVINLENGTTGEHQYWNYQVSALPESSQEKIKNFRELFIDAVKIRLRSDVQVGGLLSGGLDSSMIALVASNLTGKTFKCFSVVSSDKKSSEEEFIDIMQTQAGINSKKLFLSPEATWSRVQEVLKHNDEPFASFSVVAQNQIIQMVKKESGIKVLLTGQGADEILCGYRKFFFFYLWLEWRQGHIVTVFKNVFFSFINGTIITQVFLSGAQRYLPLLQKFRRDPLDDILVYKGKLKPIWQAESVRARQILDIDNYSIPSITHHEDRNTMAYGVEVRLPFLDYRLVNYALSLPDNLKIKNGWTKYIARKAFFDLPKAIAWRKDKKGFTVPEETWLKHDFKEKILDLFTYSKLHELGIINKDNFLKVYRVFLKGNDRQKIYYDLRRFVLAELWLKNIDISK